MDAVLTAMVHEKIGPGEQASRLIQIAKEYLDFDFCMALRSPVNALSIALRALDLPTGSSVLISALSPQYYITVLTDLGLNPVCVDVDESSLCVTVDLIRAKLNQDVRAIALHHTLGFVPDVPALLELNIPIIEDCSRSFGSHWLDRRSGTYGVFTYTWIGGAGRPYCRRWSVVVCPREAEGTVLRHFSDLPAEYRLPDLNAALATIQFKEAERNYEKRKEIAGVFTQAALRIRHKRPFQIGEGEYNNFSFPLILETGMKDVVSYAAKKDVEIDSAFSDTVAGKFPDVSRSCQTANSLVLRTALFPAFSSPRKITRSLKWPRCLRLYLDYWRQLTVLRPVARVLLIVNLNKENACQLMREIESELAVRGVSVSICSFEGKPIDPPNERFDLAFSLGGDGTVLYAARCMADRGVPILPIHLGTLGFIASVQRNEWLSVFESFVEGRVQASSRLDARYQSC
jgi:dTDP-4-amino-4,6-dideoxygalactose transaminase